MSRSKLPVEREQMIAMAMQRLSPQSLHALRAVAKLQEKTPEEVLEEELRDYVGSQIPAVDVEAIIQNMSPMLYQAGYTLGRLRAWAQDWQRRRDLEDE